MELTDIPVEILIKIVECLSKQADINSVVCLNRTFYGLFNDYLYYFNVEHFGGDALLDAAWSGQESTARKLLDLGANIDIRTPGQNTRFKGSSYLLEFNSNEGSGDSPSPTPLYLGASQGNFSIVKLLLDRGANPEARASLYIPLYTALRARHDEISLEIAQRMPNIHGSVFNNGNHFTPLHAASYWACPRCTRHLLERGANVDERNERGKTALWEVLRGPISSKGNTWAERAFIDPDKIIKTIRVLLEFGANPDAEIQIREGSRKSASRRPAFYTSPRLIAKAHEYERVRLLFRKEELEG